MRVDVDGDGLPDAVSVAGTRLVVVGTAMLDSVQLPPSRTRPRVDGAIHLRGMPGALLLVRIGSSGAGITDAVYAFRRGALRRLHVPQGRLGGIVTAVSAQAFVDVDCGAAPRTLEQITAEPRGSVWQETVSTFTLQPQGFVLAAVGRRTLTSAQVSRRRCPLLRLP
jgi:hypothetical protein